MQALVDDAAGPMYDGVDTAHAVPTVAPAFPASVRWGLSAAGCCRIPRLVNGDERAWHLKDRLAEWSSIRTS